MHLEDRRQEAFQAPYIPYYSQAQKPTDSGYLEEFLQRFQEDTATLLVDTKDTWSSLGVDLRHTYSMTCGCTYPSRMSGEKSSATHLSAVDTLPPCVV